MVDGGSTWLPRGGEHHGDALIVRKRLDQWSDDQGDYAHQLHQDVQGWASGVLEGVTHRVAYDSSIVRIRTFRVNGAVNFGLIATIFERFLGIVPGATGVGHKDS